MASNPIMDTVRRTESKAVEQLMEAVKALGSNDMQEADRLLTEASKNWKKTNKEEKKDIKGDIKFKVPEDTLESWCDKLRKNKIKPMHFVHFREMNGRLMANINAKTYTLDEGESGNREIEILLARKQEASQEEINRAYEKGVLSAKIENDKAINETGTWILLSRIAENDTSEDDAMIRYVENDNNQIDYFYSVRNLASLGERLGYTEYHYKNTLDRWVSYFDPQLRPLTERMGMNEMATFLSNLTLPESEYEMIEREINGLVRKQGDKIISVMTYLKALAETKYRELNQVEKELVISKIMITGLLNMTSGKTKASLVEALNECKRKNIDIEWESFLEGVVKCEIFYGLPTENLRYKKATEQTISNFNIDTKVENKLNQMYNDVNFTEENLESCLENDAFSNIKFEDRSKQDRKSDRKLDTSDKHQESLNNILVDTLAAKVAEKMDKDNKEKDEKSLDRKSRKDSERVEKYRSKTRQNDSTSRESSEDRKNDKRSKSKNSYTKRSSSKSKASRSRSYSRGRNEGRDRSISWPERDYKGNRGITYSANYDPRKEKRCLKCMTEDEHHEFQCKKFYRRSRISCKNCESGFHFPEECDKKIRSRSKSSTIRSERRKN